MALQDIVSKVYKITWVFSKTSQGLSKLEGKIKAWGFGKKGIKDILTSQDKGLSDTMRKI